MQNNSLISVINSANSEKLFNLLEHAKVSVGHYNGRHISVTGYTDYVTFTNFVTRVEAIYYCNVHEMQEKQKRYDKLANGGNILSIAFKATISIPQMTEEEEATISAAISWRETMDMKMNQLYVESQEIIDQKASEDCSWYFIKQFDSWLDTKATLKKSTCPQDRLILEKMIKVRTENQKSLLGHTRDLVGITANLINAVGTGVQNFEQDLQNNPQKRNALLAVLQADGH